MFSLKTIFITIKIKYDSQSSSLWRMIGIGRLLKILQVVTPPERGDDQSFSVTGECRGEIKPILLKPSIRL